MARRRHNVELVCRLVLRKCGNGKVVHMSWQKRCTNVSKLSRRGGERASLCYGSPGVGASDGVARKVVEGRIKKATNLKR